MGLARWLKGLWGEPDPPEIKAAFRRVETMLRHALSYKIESMTDDGVWLIIHPDATMVAISCFPRRSRSEPKDVRMVDGLEWEFDWCLPVPRRWNTKLTAAELEKALAAARRGEIRNSSGESIEAVFCDRLVTAVDFDARQALHFIDECVAAALRASRALEESWGRRTTS